MKANNKSVVTVYLSIICASMTFCFAASAGELQLQTFPDNVTVRVGKFEKRFVIIAKDASVTFWVNPTKTLDSLSWTFTNGDPGEASGNDPAPVVYSNSAWGVTSPVEFKSSRTDSDQNTCETDRTTCTVVVPKVENIKATIGGGTFITSNTDLDFDESDLLVLPNNVGDVTIEARSLTPTDQALQQPIKDKLKWAVKRNSADALSGSSPTITPNASNPLNASLTTNAQGSFNIILYCDSNSNSSFDEDQSEQVAVLNVALLTTQVGTNSIIFSKEVGFVSEQSEHGDDTGGNNFVATGGDGNPRPNSVVAQARVTILV